jgi:tetratricopeptide (TPR) repeat protein
MSRPIALPLLTLSALISLAAGCGGSDRPKISSESVGATTPSVSGSVPTTASAALTPVTYESAESAFGKGRYTEATQLFTTYTESNQENPWGYYMLGLSAWKAGDHDRATSAFDRALQLDPNHRKSLFNSSRVLLEIGKPQAALERIEKALTLEPMSSEGLRLLGRAHYGLAQVDQAIDAYHRALVVDERDVWSMNNLGLIYIEQGRSPEALPALARAVELRDNSPVFQNNLGTALEKSGYPLAASKAYEAAIAVDSSYNKASLSLARVTTSGQEPEAEPVDLGTLSAKFQAEIETWRDSTTPVDSGVVPDSSVVPDPSTGSIVGLSDSSRASVEAVTDTLEDCATEDSVVAK